MLKSALWILPLLAIVITTIIFVGKYRFHKMVKGETSMILERVDHSETCIVAEKDISRLPAPVQRWLVSSGMIGKPCIRVAEVRQKAEMKLKPDQEEWLSATALQYTTTEVPAFIWTVNMKMNPLAFISGRDKYIHGRGEMLIRLNSVINVVNAGGEKITEGSLQRYLGEMVWFPSLALSEFISWEEINDSSAEATMIYLGMTGKGTFYFDRDGNFTRFSALRYMGNDDEAKRYEWVLEVDSYRIFDGIKVPDKMTATWKLDDGDWTWLRLMIEDIIYNQTIHQN